MLSTDRRRSGRHPSDASQVTAVGVVIPARDEADRIVAAIDAVVASCRRVEAVCTIVVVDDSSSDPTASLARDALAGHDGPWHVLTERVGRAGAGRRIGGEVFLTDVVDTSSTWLLSTDADSVVPLDWVERFIEHHEAGEVAVAGVVGLVDDQDGRRVEAQWRADYGATILFDGSHPHVHAANLGVRADVYQRVGGYRDLERIEDIDLWDRLRSDGVRPVADARIVVATSARTEGRVAAGFAAALDRLYG